MILNKRRCEISGIEHLVVDYNWFVLDGCVRDVVVPRNLVFRYPQR